MAGTGITKQHLVGAAIGLGAAVGAIYLYKKNQAKVDEFLKKQGINIKPSTTQNFDGMDIESLTEMKEHLEDLIAEKVAESTEDCSCDEVVLSTETE
ncbi:MAG: hypothetical protein KGV57_01240 [Fusobacterium sp.]|nr:hypothetical protein [Fusobacterium sp.]